MDLLPRFIQLQLPCEITQQRAIDKALLDRIELELTNGGSFLKQSQLYTQINAVQFYRNSLEYYDVSSQKETFIGSGQLKFRLHPLKIQPFGEFKKQAFTKSLT
jgi:hypothetical protein